MLSRTIASSSMRTTAFPARVCGPACATRRLPFSGRLKVNYGKWTFTDRRANSIDGQKAAEAFDDRKSRPSEPPVRVGRELVKLGEDVLR